MANKYLILIYITFVVLASCNKEDNTLNETDNYPYEATIVGIGDKCSYYVLNITNISGDSAIHSGVYFANELNGKFHGENPLTGSGYEGARIKLNCSPIKDQNFNCEFMGRAIPFVEVISASMDENQEDDIDQRKMNNSSTCLPFRKVYGTNQYDINQDSITDIEFIFNNWTGFNEDSVWTFSDLSINSFANLIFLTNGKPVSALTGDTIKYDGILSGDWDNFRAGTYLLRYWQRTATWDETFWEFGKTGYLKLLINSDNLYHTAWIQFSVDLDTSCKCSVTVLDSYFNPLPNQNCIVGLK